MDEPPIEPTSSYLVGNGVNNHTNGSVVAYSIYDKGREEAQNEYVDFVP